MKHKLRPVKITQDDWNAGYERFKKIKSEIDTNNTKRPGPQTICGYPIDDLIKLAFACRNFGVTNDELRDFIRNVDLTADCEKKVNWDG